MRYVLLLTVAVAMSGCGRADYNKATAPVADSGRVPSTYDAPAGAEQFVTSNAEPQAGAVETTLGAVLRGPVESRKIIYTAQVSLVVEDLSQTAAKIEEQVKKLGGFVANSREDRTQGNYLTGRWVVRVPVASFDEFLGEVGKLGVAETMQSDGQDVSEEYVDLKARIENKKRLEERILKLLEEKTGKISDVIAVETELGRVREEIERMQGRVRYLDDRTSLSTVTISAREEKDYQPPQAPGFLAQVQTTWQGSLKLMKDTAEAIALAAVGASPWLGVAVVLLWPIVWRFRRRARRASA